MSKPNPINTSAAVDLVTTLMAIPGKSGHEREVAEAITTRLRKAGVPSKAIRHDTANSRSPAGGEVGNLIVKLPGTIRAPRRLLMAHIDTVPLCVGCRPVRRGELIESRDASTALGGDDRAGACVVLTSVLEILKQDLPHPPLTLFFPVQEEIGLYGARFVSLSRLGKPAMGFNWDGGAPGLAVVGATGDYSIDVVIDGIASHAGGHPEDGVSAIAVASLAIADLTENGWHGLIEKGRNRGTSNVGIINAGDATNVVTPRLTLKAEARSHDPRFRKRIVATMRDEQQHMTLYLERMEALGVELGSVPLNSFFWDLISPMHTPMDFVVDVLRSFFNMNVEKATQIMLKVHTEGKGVCGVYGKDVAETKAAQVNDYSREYEQPLLCSVEVDR